MTLRLAYPILLLGLANFLAVAGLYGQEGKASVKPGSDVLIFNDGEKLIGHLQSATSASVTFKSDMAGEITVDWSKVKELHTAQKFAVIPKGVELRNGVDTSQVPQGTVSMAAQKLDVHPEGGRAPQAIPVGDTAHVIDEPAFQKAVSGNPGFFKEWKGAITAGASLVQATQTSRSFSGSVNLVRAIPSETWLDPRNRTTLNFTAAYGVLDQPKTAEIKTEIYHADAERDEYFSPRLYAFGQLAYDHNYSQGLDLQQLYGGGIGWTALKDASQALDLKASLSYIEQSFTGAIDQSLFGSTFAEDYNRKFVHGILLTEQLAITPAWTNTNAYSALGNLVLTMPVYKRFNITFGTVDTFLNDPPPGFKKNSFQLTTGLAYTLQ